MDGIKVGLAHTEHPKIGQKNISIFYLMLGAVLRDVHTVTVLYKVAFTKDGTDYSQSAGGDDSLVGEFNFHFLHGILLLLSVLYLLIISEN